MNCIDREIRKDVASHARESVQFSRNASNLMLRHAQVAGVDPGEFSRLTQDFFTKRVFWEEGQWLSPSAMRTRHRRGVTPLKEEPERLWKYLEP